MSNTAHHDWVDSVADWAESHPITQRAHRALPQCSGACEQGRKDCACTTGHVIDRVREDYDVEDQSQSADGVFWTYMAVMGAVIAAAVLAVLS